MEEMGAVWLKFGTSSLGAYVSPYDVTDCLGQNDVFVSTLSEWGGGPKVQEFHMNTPDISSHWPCIRIYLNFHLQFN